MGFSCSCDDGPEWFRTTTRTARKPHACCECRETIQTGAAHTYTVGKWDGDISTFRTCERCADLIAHYSEAGYCWTYGTLWADHLDMLLAAPKAQQSARAIALARSIVYPEKREAA